MPRMFLKRMIIPTEKLALAGNRTRASRVAGENSTTEPPVPWPEWRDCARDQFPCLAVVYSSSIFFNDIFKTKELMDVDFCRFNRKRKRTKGQVSNKLKKFTVLTLKNALQSNKVMPIQKWSNSKEMLQRKFKAMNSSIKIVSTVQKRTS